MPSTCRQTGRCSITSGLCLWDQGGYSSLDYRHVDFPEHLSSFAGIQQGNVLRRRHNDGTWEHGRKKQCYAEHPSSLETLVGVFLYLVLHKEEELKTPLKVHEVKLLF